MRAEANQFNDVIDPIHPNEQKVALDVTLHASLVLTKQ